ncbi:MAG: M23 family metallopeptidase [Bacteroidetes bacterium]|nr:M23 family metallopeptidase [Bacteroidota bacterium]
MKIFIFNITVALLFLQSVTFSQSKNICDKWDVLDSLIVNSLIEKGKALELMKEYEPEVRSYFRKQRGVMTGRNDWVFPLKNYSSFYYRDNGNDYRKSGYDYFQGSNTKGHPAHDIMIPDSNKDLMDDVTLKPVDVVSMSSGVVVATDTTWNPGSLLRGGRYVKIFDVTNSCIFYYSHLSLVSVKPGDVITEGDKIGEVGRTGRKAILKGGKTHLHVACLKVKNGYPLPEDIISELKKQKK